MKRRRKGQNKIKIQEGMKATKHEGTGQRRKCSKINCSLFIFRKPLWLLPTCLWSVILVLMQLLEILTPSQFWWCVILGEGRSSPDNNIVVAPSVVTSSATQVEEQCISGLPAAGPVRTMAGRRASSDENIVQYNRQASNPFFDLCLICNV